MVVWPGADPSGLDRAGVSSRPAEEVLGEAGLAAVEAAGRTWTRLWSRLPLLDGASFRDLVTWRETSLLWLTEEFILRETAGPVCAGIVETSLRLLEGTGASEVDAHGLPPADTVLLARACTASGVLFHSTPPRARPMTLGAPPGSAFGPFEGMMAPSRAPSLPPPRGEGRPSDRPALVVLTDRADEGGELGPLLETAATELPISVVVVPTSRLGSWRTRGVVRQTRDAIRRLHDLWERLHDAPGVRDSYKHRDVGFSDLAAGDLARILEGHLPRAVVQLESALELMRSTPPPACVAVDVVSRDERRTLLAAACLAGVPTAVLRRAERGADPPDRQDGGPRGDVTLAWEPGAETGSIVARLAELARARVEPE